jgi:hypothetical protein
MVNAVFGPSYVIKPGAKVSAVFYVDGHPVALTSTVCKTAPLTLTTTDQNSLAVEVGKRLLLILQDSGQFAKAEAQVTKYSATPNGWAIEVGQFGWEEVDRRRYPRHTVQIPVVVKAVMEHEGAARLNNVHTETIDVSLGGVWIKAKDDLVPGSLVEFQAEVNGGEHVRTLAIVAWRCEEVGIGLEFVDFLGSSRYYLHSFLSKAA